MNGVPDFRDPYGRIHAAALTTAPRAVVAGWSAAMVLGVPTTFIDGTSTSDALRPVCVNPRLKSAQRKGIHFTFSELTDDDVIVVDGIAVTSGVRTAFDCIRFARDRFEALALVDACLRFGLTTADDLVDYARARRRWPGIRRVRELIPIATPFAESPMESWMRLVWLDAALPQPLVNPTILAPDGSHLARVDLLEPETGLVGEYDGKWHELGAQPVADDCREQLVRVCKFAFVRATAVDTQRSGLELGGRLRNTWRTRMEKGLRPSSLVRIVPQSQ